MAYGKLVKETEDKHGDYLISVRAARNRSGNLA